MKRVVFALALAAGPLLAAQAGTVPVVVQASPVQPDRIVTMTGEGIVKAMPDTAVVSGGVETRARRAADALRDNNEAMAKAVAALKAAGVTDKEITTASVTFAPQYERDRNGVDTNHVVGYAVSNRIIVTLTAKIERAGAVFDTLIQNGANDATAVGFEIRDREPLENQARTEAARNALAKAQVYAKALGLELGAIRLVSENGGNYVVDQIQAEDIGGLPDHNIAEALQRVPGVRIEASEQTIRRAVTVTWSLK